jgi:hypothetical protein
MVNASTVTVRRFSRTPSQVPPTGHCISTMSRQDRAFERLEEKIDKFLLNDFRHLAEDVAGLKTQVKLLSSLFLIVAAAAVALFVREVL